MSLQTVGQATGVYNAAYAGTGQHHAGGGESDRTTCQTSPRRCLAVERDVTSASRTNHTAVKVDRSRHAAGKHNDDDDAT